MTPRVVEALRAAGVEPGTDPVRAGWALALRAQIVTAWGSPLRRRAAQKLALALSRDDVDEAEAAALWFLAGVVAFSPSTLRARPTRWGRPVPRGR